MAFTVPNIFTLVDRFSGPANGIGKSLEKFSDKATKLSNKAAVAGAAILAPMALAAKSAAAFEDREYFRNTCKLVIDSREKLVAQLQAKGFEVLPSAANFIFARHPGHDAAGLAAKVREQGVIVRHFKQERIAQFLRISIGTPEQNQALIDGLGDL